MGVTPTRSPSSSKRESGCGGRTCPLPDGVSSPITLAAILLEIDANELNNVFASRHFIIFKIGKIGNYLGCSEYA